MTKFTGGVSLTNDVTLMNGEMVTPDDIDLEAIMILMNSKYTIDFVDRHVTAIRKLCKVCHEGLLLKHLEPLVRLLQLAVLRFSQGQSEFALAICEFTQVAARPFISQKASDMVTYGHHLPAFIKTLVSVLTCALPPTEDTVSKENQAALAVPDDRRAMNEKVRIEVAQALACWSRYGLDDECVEVQDTGTANLRILQQAHVIDELSASFRVEDSPDAIIITLGAIRDMSLYRPLARQITNSGLVSNLIHVIRVNLLGSDVLLVTAEILWNVLELDREGAAEALGQADVIESFCDFMQVILTNGYRFKDKIFRNDMMVLLMYISKRPENRPLFASTGLMESLLTHGIFGRDGRRIPGQDPFKPSLNPSGERTTKNATMALTNSQEDLEFRIMLWSTLARCCSDEHCAQVATECGLVQSLLSHLDSNDASRDQRQWSQEQKRNMQLEALSALFVLVEHIPDSFSVSEGSAIVLRLLQNTSSREVQKKCLHLLQVAVRTGPQFAIELGVLGAVGTLIELFTDKCMPMNGRRLCISVLASLCSGHSENCREFRRRGGVEAIRQEVVYRPDETTDNHLFYTLCVVDCVWCAIVGTRKNEVRFIDAGGLYALVDVLEVAPLMLKRQIIGCLADLLQFRKAAKLFVQWNSQRTMKGVLKILLELWQNEQEATGSTMADGVMCDTSRPLNPSSKELSTSIPTGAHASGSSAGSVGSVGNVRRTNNACAATHPKKIH